MSVHVPIYRWSCPCWSRFLVKVPSTTDPNMTVLWVKGGKSLIVGFATQNGTSMRGTTFFRCIFVIIHSRVNISVYEVAHAQKQNPLSDFGNILQMVIVITCANFGDSVIKGGEGQFLPFLIRASVMWSYDSIFPVISAATALYRCILPFSYESHQDEIWHERVYNAIQAKIGEGAPIFQICTKLRYF